LLFIGAMGKSAQLGFHTWLPDAMEGPTPVSALIHAATMVTAGVFLVARMSPLFEFAPGVLEIVTWVGGLTAIVAATIGMTQHDIKRVIAYSTCSQLGYMFFACGIGAYPAAIFHLTTHAFFKAVLFLGAGSIIHGISDEQDMRKMGGLRYALPVTYFIMLIGSLALMGVPPFAGYFSKDLILESAFMSGTESGLWMYGLGTAAAFMTAFYSARVFYLAFYGKNRGDAEVYKHSHESGMVMLAPMIVLLIGAVFSGWLLHDMGSLDWWRDAIDIQPYHTGLENAHDIAWQWKYLPLAIVGLGGLLGTLFYLWKTDFPLRFVGVLGFIHTFVYRKWMIDELYNGVFVCSVKYLSHKLYRQGDVKIIDGFFVNGLSKMTNFSGLVIRKLQTGYLFHYAFAVVFGMCIIVTWLIF
jgi:NADH-quinone oxidoreductase subunit L